MKEISQLVIELNLVGAHQVSNEGNITIVIELNLLTTYHVVEEETIGRVNKPNYIGAHQDDGEGSVEIINENLIILVLVKYN
jgi:hypothetical protein